MLAAGERVRASSEHDLGILEVAAPVVLVLQGPGGFAWVVLRDIS